MKSFSSSAINKSGKKFAPKAPARRPTVASTAPVSAKTHVDSRSTSQTPQSTQVIIAPPPSITEPVKTTPKSHSDTTQQPDASEISIPISKIVSKPSSSISNHGEAVNESQPLPKRTASKFQETRSAVSIPIPTPRSSQSTMIGLSLPVSQLPPKAQDNSAPVNVRVQSQKEQGASTSAKERQNLEPVPDNQLPVTAAASPSEDNATEMRPAKRIKTSEVVNSADDAEDAILPPASSLDAQQERTEPHDVTQNEFAASVASKKGRNMTKTRKKRTALEEKDAEPVSENAGAKRKRTRKTREPTPEDAELIEIAPTIVKMSDLCKDLRTGKKSKREMELRSLDEAELERRQKERDEERKSGTPARQTTNNEGSLRVDSAEKLQKRPQAGPRMRIVNGEIVIDTASLQVDRHADTSRNAGDLEDVIENPHTRKINQATYGKRTKIESWDEEMTDLFYRGLRTFGTDFMMISKMFPGRSRRQIKLKFNNEERRDPERIEQTLLGPRESIDIETYSEMTNTVYDDPLAIQKELDEEKKRIEAQHAKEKAAQEELLRNPSGAGGDTNVIPSTEQATGNPKGRSRGVKKAAMFKGISEGTEEILGSIDDLPIPA